MTAASAVELAVGPEPGAGNAGRLDRQVRATIKRRGELALWLACGWVAAVVLVAVFANFLPLRRDDLILFGLDPGLPPRLSWTEPLGTDALGRSVAARLAFGARESLIVAVTATLIAMSIGSLVGITSGFFRGRVDALLGVLLDAMLAIPPLVLLLAIASVGKRDVSTVILGLGVVGIPTFGRLARANTIARAKREYVLAARAMGAGNLRILLRELLPEVVLPVSSYGFLFLAHVIVVEATLSFVGLGVPPPKPSWGEMINEGQPYLASKPWLIFIPALCIVVTVVSLTVIGDHARRRFDVRGSALE